MLFDTVHILLPVDNLTDKENLTGDIIELLSTIKENCTLSKTLIATKNSQ